MGDLEQEWDAELGRAATVMTVDQAAITRSTITNMAKLTVSPIGPGVLDVDATALASRHDPTHWWLQYHEGIWHHAPSATSGPLTEMLRSIAMTYLVEPAHG
jgi:hypothetical protein